MVKKDGSAASVMDTDQEQWALHQLKRKNAYIF